MIKKIFVSLLLTILIVSQICTICYAETIQITEESLEQAILDFASSLGNYENFNVSVQNNVVTINAENETFTYNCDLTARPTFTSAVEINADMSEEEMEQKMNNFIGPIFSYAAIAHMHGVESTDSMYYLMISCLCSCMDAVKQLNSEELFDPNATDYDYEEVFTAMEEIFNKLSTISDSDGINSYTLKVEMTDISATSFTLKTNLVIEPNAEIERVKGYMDRASKDFSDLFETSNFNNIDELTNVLYEKMSNLEYTSYLDNSNSAVQDADVQEGTGKLPKTGLETNYILIALFIVFGTCSVGLIILLPKIKNKK